MVNLGKGCLWFTHDLLKEHFSILADIVYDVNGLENYNYGESTTRVSMILRVLHYCFFVDVSIEG